MNLSNEAGAVESRCIISCTESRPSAGRATLYSWPYHLWETTASTQAFTGRMSHSHWHLHKQEGRTAARGTGHAIGREYKFGCAICEYHWWLTSFCSVVYWYIYPLCLQSKQYPGFCGKIDLGYRARGLSVLYLAHSEYSLPNDGCFGSVDGFHSIFLQLPFEI